MSLLFKKLKLINVIALLVKISGYLNFGLLIKIQFKILNSIQKTETGLKGEWFTKLKETKGIYEFRERDSKYFY